LDLECNAGCRRRKLCPAGGVSTRSGHLAAGTSSFALADFNGDHLPDFAAISNGALQVFLGKGDGTFASPASYFVGTSPGTLVAADFNKDGKLDVAVAGQAGLGILFGKGDGAFQPVMFSTIQPLSGVFTTGDFNEDGNADIIAQPLQILLGRGDGTFTSRPVFPNKVTAGAEIFIGAADFNGDGKLDLLGINDIGNKQCTVYVTLGDGDGTFGSPDFLCNLCNTNFAVIGDFNVDGRPDLVINDSNGIATLLKRYTLRARFCAIGHNTLSQYRHGGGSATATITISPAGGFATAVKLSCTVTLNGSTCSTATTAPPVCAFNPPSIAGGSGTSMLIVTTTGKSALIPRCTSAIHVGHGRYCCPSWVRRCRTGLRLKRTKSLGFLLIGLALSALRLFASCGGGGSSTGGGSGGTPAGHYTIAVTGSASGATSQTSSLTLTVQ
jgi:FG-GAP-like repeat